MNGKLSITTWMGGVQWLFFIFTNTIVVPLSIGQAFQLPPEEIAAALQRSFLLTGAVCIVQALIGHRYAVMDGASGVWWGLALDLASSAHSAGLSLASVGGSLAAGFLLSSVLTIVLGMLGFASVLQKLFTPVVKSVVLFLLTIQLTVGFFKGMIDLQPDGSFNLAVAALSAVLALLVVVLQLKGHPLVANFSILISIIAGWIAYVLLFGGKPPVHISGGALFSLFPWGKPNLEIGIIAASCIVGFINMTNTVTALSSVERLYGTATSDSQYKRSFLWTGMFSVLASLFGLLPFGLFTSSVGFLESTKILQRRALIAGAGMLIVIGAVPPAAGFLSTLPASVGSAVLFVAYLQMFGTALQTVQNIPFGSRTVYRIALPVLLGISIMNVPAETFLALPMYVSPLVRNGLVMGVLLAIVLENAVDWSKLASQAGSARSSGSTDGQQQ